MVVRGRRGRVEQLRIQKAHGDLSSLLQPLFTFDFHDTKLFDLQKSQDSSTNCVGYTSGKVVRDNCSSKHRFSGLLLKSYKYDSKSQRRAFMRALRYYNPGDLRLEFDLPEPQCGKDQVKMKPSIVGICGTDLHEYSSSTFIPVKDKPHPVTGESRPVTIGHEISGIVVEIGSDVEDKSIKIGDKVAIQSTLCCFACPFCEQKMYNCCIKSGFLGLSGGGGGLSDFLCVNGLFVHKLPDSIGTDVGALVEPLATCWRAVTESGLQPREDVLIFGAGPIGLGVVQCCKARGAKNIIVAEVAAQRQVMAKKFGATHVWNPLERDIVQATREVSEDGLGSHISIDCAGLPDTLTAACIATRPRGMIVNVAIWEKPTTFNPNLLTVGEKKYHSGESNDTLCPLFFSAGNFELKTTLRYLEVEADLIICNGLVVGYSQEDFKGVINAIRDGSMNPHPMITRTISIDRVVEDGFEALKTGKDREIKIQIDLSKK